MKWWFIIVRSRLVEVGVGFVACGYCQIPQHFQDLRMGRYVASIDIS